MIGYRIALAPSPYIRFPPLKMRSRRGSMSAVVERPDSRWKERTALRYDFAVVGLTEARIWAAQCEIALMDEGYGLYPYCSQKDS